jgi:hypothetical protein
VSLVEKIEDLVTTTTTPVNLLHWGSREEKESDCGGLHDQEGGVDKLRADKYKVILLENILLAEKYIAY